MYKNEILESELRDFLIEAKKQSYANSSAEKAMPEEFEKNGKIVTMKVHFTCVEDITKE